MKSSHARKVILALLSVLLIYIWWGNVRTFHRSSDSYSASPFEQDTAGKTEQSVQPLAYRGVKVNPFRRTIDTPDRAAKPPAKPTEEKPPPMLSEVAHLTGLVEKGVLSQAVITTRDSQTFVLSLQDTLVYWSLNEVTPTFAVFRQGKYYDTLWLETMRR